MKAIVFLCLLEVVYGLPQSKYSNLTWGRPGVSGNENPHACMTDQGSCGCCLMQQQMNRMKTFFNMTINALEEELTKTKAILNSVRSSRSAFSVALTNGDPVCFGPFRDDRLIVYKHVFINLGNSYDVTTGVFTVPRSGAYSVALTVYSDAGSPGNSLAACANLQVNGHVVAGPRERNMQDQEDSASIAVVLTLTSGDLVAVNLPIGCFLCDDNSHYNTFTAYLLYATD